MSLKTLENTKTKLHKVEDQEYRRGDIWLVDFNGGATGSEMTGVRPAVIISGNIGNRFSSNVVLLAISSQINKKLLPTHVYLKAEEHNLERDSIVLCEMITTKDKWNLMYKLTSLDYKTMADIEVAIKVNLGIEY
ncbi:type II toxin-antitoxin system PemK/MazF family toxin [Paenibacillus elgii]|uniref:type II toxin-antitoxin system PemK/MazF family toxin n=1 Tax=Paenibacillus elgii TaxID=189691 RepID=UPI000248D645|nr:type II toxin-antitoxin system PemK/MazF family toxin [Paenibacillus elgii]